MTPIRSALSEIKRAPEACGHGWVSPKGLCVMCGAPVVTAEAVDPTPTPEQCPRCRGTGYYGTYDDRGTGISGGGIHSCGCGTGPRYVAMNAAPITRLYGTNDALYVYLGALPCANTIPTDSEGAE